MIKSLNLEFLNVVEQKLDKDYSLSDSHSEKFGIRGAYLSLVPVSAITSIVDTAIGACAAIPALATAGKHKKTINFFFNFLESSFDIVSKPYVNLLKTLNPTAKLPPIRGFDEVHPGICTPYPSEKLDNLAENYFKSKNFFKKHVASRLTYVLLAITFVITRIVDGIIGLIAAAFSLITLGKLPFLNKTAYRGLCATGIIHDLFYCTLKVINPWACE
ncbi:MAG: hypothetical protein JJU12_07425 [Chlamydiales bacterium]|nr:hypothetical protein [Chlamydiales bacterium]